MLYLIYKYLSFNQNRNLEVLEEECKFSSWIFPPCSFCPYSWSPCLAFWLRLIHFDSINPGKSSNDCYRQDKHLWRRSSLEIGKNILGKHLYIFPCSYTFSFRNTITGMRNQVNAGLSYYDLSYIKSLLLYITIHLCTLQQCCQETGNEWKVEKLWNYLLIA